MDTWLKLPPPERGSKLTVPEADPRIQQLRLDNEFKSLCSEYKSTLTAQQRRLLMAEMPVEYTPHQQALREKMESYVAGLTLGQIKGQAHYEARPAGERDARWIKFGVILFVVVAILSALLSL